MSVIAFLDIKCWGQNWYGQLGLGDTANRGDGFDEASNMGDSLSAVDPGTSFTPKIVATGASHVVIISTDGTVKAWGRGMTF